MLDNIENNLGGRLVGTIAAESSPNGVDWNFDEDGTNTIVKGSRLAVLDALSGSDSGHIATYKLGKTVSPAPPDLFDTENSDPSATVKSFTSADIERDGEATTYTLTLQADEGDVGDYTEMTLHTGDGRLFARYTFFNPIPKDATIWLRFKWKIGYV